MSRKLGVVHLGRQNVTALVPDIVRRQFDAPGDKTAKLAEFFHGSKQAAAKAGYMGAALGGRNEVDIAFGDNLSLFRQPDYRPGHHFFFAFLFTDKRLFRNSVEVLQVFEQIVLQTILEIPGIGFAGVLVGESNRQTRTQDGFGAQDVL